MCQDARGTRARTPISLRHDSRLRYFVRTRDESSVGITFDRNYVARKLRFNIKNDEREGRKVLFGRNGRINKVARGDDCTRETEKEKKGDK